ncbi:MAG TPA: amylo-alpha-1,6-glucosidase [Verrucomicrobiae bacterium]|nr:amylo-alpha-1,6-glucosidase [Verrucomicrobiae bacterium]
MKTVFDQSECQNLKNALSKEWLEANGLGGFASSSIIGANTRRQHGLLVASLRPPGERRVLLSKFEERVAIDGHESSICTNLYPGTVFPHGFNIQLEFRLRPWPTFRYANNEFEIEKSVFLVHGENELVASYRCLRARTPLELKVRPLLAFRDYGALSKRNDKVNLAMERHNGSFAIHPYDTLPALYFYTKPDLVDTKADWYFRFTYPVEQERGLDFEEDLFTPCELTYRLSEGQTVYIVVTTDRKNGVNPEDLVAREHQRRQQFEREPDPIRQALLIAADSFIARRGKDHLTVLAGFPWFTDWGRDTMIALPGLTLTSNRFDVARKIFLTFAQYCDRGMIPNVLPDADDAPQYNSVDASLWFVVTAWKYWKASADDEGTRQLLPALSEVVRNYKDGTRYDIYADHDGLITAGTPGTQLTWMDVNVDGYIPTPRHGKPVEVNALWLNVLLMLAEMTEKLARDIQSAVILRKLADQVAGSFMKAYWFADGGYLYDVIQGNFKDAAIRPNQIFAVSLPYSALDKAQQKAVFDVVTSQLLTPYGLRTLNPKNEKYCGKYAGNRWQRDCAYHQGTVWPWLIGAYCDAYAKVYGSGKVQRKEIAKIIQPLLDHLSSAGLGTVSEIFDGDFPHHPVGCFAQAWSVSELLRVYDTYVR